MRLGEHCGDFAGERMGDLGRPAVKDQTGSRERHLLPSDEARQSGEEDQEGKKRRQRRQRNMTGDGPAVVAGEFDVGVEEGAEDGHEVRENL